MSESVELKACPFCGGPAEIWRANQDFKRKAWIACMGRCAVLTRERLTDAEAIEAWNRRVSAAPSEGGERGSDGGDGQAEPRLPAANHEALQDLLRRVESAAGPSIDLNADILRSFGWTMAGGHVFDPDGLREFSVPLPVASLDAALALVERVLPGWEFAIEVERSTDGPTIWRVEMGDPLRGWQSEAPTPALALCIALLRALIARSAKPLGRPGGRGVNKSSAEVKNFSEWAQSGNAEGTPSKQRLTRITDMDHPRTTKPLFLPADPVQWAIGTLGEVAEYLKRFADTNDGENGAPEPNEAAYLLGEVETAIERLERAGHAE